MKIIEQMPDDEYHAMPQISSSKLKKLDRSANKFRYGSDTKDSAALRFGRLVHAVLLDPPEKYVEVGTKTAGKAYEQAMAEASKSDYVCLSHELESAFKIVDRILSDPHRKQAVVGGKKELAIFDDKFKAKLDLLDGNTIYDLKTIREIKDERQILREIVDRRYYISEAFYRMMLDRSGILSCDHDQIGFEFWFIDKSEPIEIVPVSLSPEFMRFAKLEVERLIEYHQNCIDLDYWPQAINDKIVLEKPDWL